MKSIKNSEFSKIYKPINVKVVDSSRNWYQWTMLLLSIIAYTLACTISCFNCKLWFGRKTIPIDSDNIWAQWSPWRYIYPLTSSNSGADNQTVVMTARSQIFKWKIFTNLLVYRLNLMLWIISPQIIALWLHLHHDMRNRAHETEFLLPTTNRFSVLGNY